MDRRSLVSGVIAALLLLGAALPAPVDAGGYNDSYNDPKDPTIGAIVSVRGEVALGDESVAHALKRYASVSNDDPFDDSAWSRFRKAKVFDTLPSGTVVLVREGSATLSFIRGAAEAVDEGQQVAGAVLGDYSVMLVSYRETLAFMSGALRTTTLELLEGTVRYTTWEAWQHQQEEAKLNFRAGPLAISVKGTDFTIEHAPREDRVSITLMEGEIVVTGPYGSRIYKDNATATYVGGKYQGGPS